MGRWSASPPRFRVVARFSSERRSHRATDPQRLGVRPASVRFGFGSLSFGSLGFGSLALWRIQHDRLGCFRYLFGDLRLDRLLRLFVGGRFACWTSLGCTDGARSRGFRLGGLLFPAVLVWGSIGRAFAHPIYARPGSFEFLLFCRRVFQAPECVVAGRRRRRLVRRPVRLGFSSEVLERRCLTGSRRCGPFVYPLRFRRGCLRHFNCFGGVLRLYGLRLLRLGDRLAPRALFGCAERIESRHVRLRRLPSPPTLGGGGIGRAVARQLRVPLGFFYFALFRRRILKCSEHVAAGRGTRRLVGRPVCLRFSGDVSERCRIAGSGRRQILSLPRLRRAGRGSLRRQGGVIL